MRLTRSLVAVPAALALLAVPAPASAAQEPPQTIPLVTGSMPEGISAGPGDTFFAGARRDGAVYVGDTSTGRLRTLVPPRQGEIAVGMLYDAEHRRLWVAGGTTGDVTAYDARSGRTLFTANAGTGRFLNDVTVTDDAVYVTDSRRAELVVVPTPDGALPAAGSFSLLPLTGAYVQPAGFGANGIRDLPTGDLLLVSGGVLYRVDPATGAAAVVPQQGRALTAGDGLELTEDGRLYVVNGYGGNEVAVLQLDLAYTTTTALGTLTDPELDRPTTGALVGDALYVVNGRFGTIATQPDAPVYVTRLPVR